MAAVQRIAVFIDWQNTYRAARRAFGLEGRPGRSGNFSPFGVGQVISGGNRRGSSWRLDRVEIHRGLPSASLDKVGHVASRRQATAWTREASGVVIPRLRPLRYGKHGDGGPSPVEKGIDVHLALAAVTSVLLDQCDVAVIFSHDSDLQPALETISELADPRRVETASWSSARYRARIPPVSGVFNHFLDFEAFTQVEDRTDYGRSRSPKQR